MAQLNNRTPIAEMEDILTSIALAGNAPTPVAARFQTRPCNVEQLVQSATSTTTIAAHHGAAYKFSDRPIQWRRPKPLRVSGNEKEAIAQEIHRLFNQCHAIEVAPPHDTDKCLLTDEAAPFELTRLPGLYLREPTIPLFKSHTQAARYDRQQQVIFNQRRTRNLPFRDFESTVFTVPKKDGGHRLCTDFRPLNAFAKKSHF